MSVFVTMSFVCYETFYDVMTIKKDLSKVLSIYSPVDLRHWGKWFIKCYSYLSNLAVGYYLVDLLHNYYI